MLNVLEAFLNETVEIGEGQYLWGPGWMRIKEDASFILLIIDRFNLNPDNFLANLHENRKDVTGFERFKRFQAHFKLL